jgi:hypothetical protein
MCNNPRKEKELIHFKAFSELYFNSEIDCEQPDPRAPDITFTHDNKNIGLEMTTLQADASPSENSLQYMTEANYKVISRTLEKRLIDKTETNFWITIHFNFEETLNTRRAYEIIKVLQPFLLDRLSKEISEEYIQSYQIDANLPEIIQIGIHSTENISQTVNISMSTHCPVLTNINLDEFIEHKALLHKDNIPNYNELWLLLLIENETLSSEFVDDDNYMDIAETEVWDKVFLFKLRSQILKILK